MSEPPSVSDSSTAWLTIVVSTSSATRVELIASPTSASASSWSTLRASSADLLSSAEKSSTCRRASAACSANVDRSSSAASSKGATCVRHTLRAPTTWSPTTIGAPIIVR